MVFPKTKPIPETHHDILVDRPTGHLASIRPDGRLSVNPVGLMWDGEHVRVSTLKSRKKYRNLTITIHAEQVSAPELPRAKTPPSAPGSESRDDGC